MMQELLKPAPGSKPLSFKSPYSTNYLTQVLHLDLQCHHASIHVPEAMPSGCVMLHRVIMLPLLVEASDSGACIPCGLWLPVCHWKDIHELLAPLLAVQQCKAGVQSSMNCPKQDPFLQLLSAADAWSALVQFKTCLSKNAMVYWRNPDYNAVRSAACFLPNSKLGQLSNSLLYTVVEIGTQKLPGPN